MKQFILLVLIGSVVFVKTAYSQSDFRDGYIITNKNDTVVGQIDYKGNRSNAKRCLFIKSGESEMRTYLPDEIKAYRYTDSKYYVSKKVNTTDGEKHLFLEFLINGIANIYYYREGTNEHYFLEKEEGNLVPLIKEQKEIEVGNTKYVKEVKRYVGTLKYEFKDAPGVINKTDNVKLDHQSLIRIAKDYNDEVCKNGKCIIYEKKVPKVSLSVGPFAGMNFMNMATKIYGDIEYVKDFNSVTNPSFGLFLKVSLPSLNERLFFQYETFYDSKTFKASNVKSSSTNYHNDLEVTFKSINNTFVMRYEFPRGKIRPVFQGGVFINYSVKTDFKSTRYVQIGSGTSNQGTSTDNQFENSNFGMVAGIGCIFNIYKRQTLQIDLKYSQGTPILSDEVQRMHTYAWSLNMGVPF